MSTKSVGPSEDTLEELIGPVCVIAELNPSTAWPKVMLELIAAARNVKALYGFEVEAMAAD
jgi:hypothetical protein